MTPTGRCGGYRLCSGVIGSSFMRRSIWTSQMCVCGGGRHRLRLNAPERRRHRTLLDTVARQRRRLLLNAGSQQRGRWWTTFPERLLDHELHFSLVLIVCDCRICIQAGLLWQLLLLVARGDDNLLLVGGGGYYGGRGPRRATTVAPRSRSAAYQQREP